MKTFRELIRERGLDHDAAVSAAMAHRALIVSQYPVPIISGRTDRVRERSLLGTLTHGRGPFDSPGPVERDTAASQASFERSMLAALSGRARTDLYVMLYCQLNHLVRDAV